MNKNGGIATFDQLDGERSRVTGSLDFLTVATLLQQGSGAIESGHAAVIDLGAVTASDSAGLSLLIEWLSVAKAARRTLHYHNVPLQLTQLARLSEVDELILTG